MKADKCLNCGKCFIIFDTYPEKCPHCKEDLKPKNPFKGTGLEDIFGKFFGGNYDK